MTAPKPTVEIFYKRMSKNQTLTNHQVDKECIDEHGYKDVN